MDNLNSFNQNIYQKYIELEKNYINLKIKLEAKNKNDQNYKTELCKKFQAIGSCPYGSKCRFAHGKEELITKLQGANYKKEKCKSFYEKGYCLYGSRCLFQHDERKFKDINYSFIYIRLFLFKYFGFLKSNNNYFKKTKLYNKRLDVFESLTQSNIGYININEQNVKTNQMLSNVENEGKCASIKSNNSFDDKVDFKQYNIFKMNKGIYNDE